MASACLPLPRQARTMVPKAIGPMAARLVLVTVEVTMTPFSPKRAGAVAPTTALPECPDVATIRHYP